MTSKEQLRKKVIHQLETIGFIELMASEKDLDNLGFWIPLFFRNETKVSFSVDTEDKCLKIKMLQDKYKTKIDLLFKIDYKDMIHHRIGSFGWLKPAVKKHLIRDAFLGLKSNLNDRLPLNKYGHSIEYKDSEFVFKLYKNNNGFCAWSGTEVEIITKYIENNDLLITNWTFESKNTIHFSRCL